MTNRVDELLKISNEISSGRVPDFQHNETFTAGAFDLLLIKVKGVEAFELLNQLCLRYETLKSDDNNLKGYYYLVSEVARQTGTTEMPENMLKIIKNNVELSTDLRKWYRYVG
ncbi:hypothetical protein [Undibacterium fentianense]|uniref:Uncharacterized protein n=1 Tax=Undibacterium fentianense TaxID=2828728 RepID=A0A941E6X3_9BURK|nr:hypothetical protein [Undibacterium fentianense]MBR7799838.1 hypothetical protein [Undibacterium fentianense]